MECTPAQVLAVAKDQNGCRFLQRKFDEGGPTAIGLVFPEVLDDLVELMTDPFGNYLIQKLLDRCSEDQRLQVCNTCCVFRFWCGSTAQETLQICIVHLSVSDPCKMLIRYMQIAVCLLHLRSYL